MKIQWINHASFIVHHCGISLIADPWLEGSAFNNGWSLLSPTQFDYDDFRHVTHIWFSHEHADHFSPSNVTRIPEQYRSQITVLYQKTKDKKIVRFCNNLNFKSVIELEPDEWYQLSDNFSILCNPWGTRDSYLCIKTDEAVWLNLNDCGVRRQNQAEQIRNKVGHIDLLLTQFSYAQWEGNEEDIAQRHSVALEMLERIQIQAEVLQPRYIMPIASYIYFSHQENSYLNDMANKINDVHRFIRENTQASPIILYPGDEYCYGAPYDNTDAIQKYLRDYELSRESALLKSDSVPISTLRQEANIFCNKIKAKNTRLLSLKSRFLADPAPVALFIWDHEKSFVFDLNGGLLPVQRGKNQCDIALSSDSLSYAFNNEWGGNTLMVNGRFRALRPGGYHKFFWYAGLSSRNNHGGSITSKDLLYRPMLGVLPTWLSSMLVRGSGKFKKIAHRVIRK